MKAAAITDTIQINQEALRPWTENADYDYKRELLQVQSNGDSWLEEQIGRLLQEIFGNEVVQGIEPKLYLVGAIIIFLTVIAFLILKRPQLFVRDKKLGDLQAETTIDNIYGIDFEGAIKQARNTGNWREAARLLYLQTLRQLTDEGRIDWKEYKTATQYAREMHSRPFSLLTNHFLRIRYGNFPATETLCNEMADLQAQIIRKGGVA